MGLFKRLRHIDLMHFAIGLVFLCTPLESIRVFGEDTNFSIVKLVTFFLFFVWLVKSRKAEVNGIISTIIALFTYFLIGVVWSIDIETSISNLLLFYLPSILLCIIISYNLKRQEDFHIIAIGYIIGCVILSYFAVKIRGQILEEAITGDMERVSAFGQDANEMAVLLDLGIGIILHYLGIENKKSFTICGLVVVALISFVIISTGSRTGVIILIGLLGIFFINNKKRVPIMVPLIVIGAVILLKYVSEGVVERLLSTSESISSNDMTGRGEIWRNGWQAFQSENIIFGVGYRNFPTMLVKHGFGRAAAHNTYLSYLICAGFLGFMIFLRLIVQIIKLVFKTHALEKKWNMLYYVFPLFTGMLMLETSHRRWLFLVAVVMYKYYLLIKKEKVQEKVVNSNSYITE